MDVGGNIKKFRKMNGLTQTELGQKIGKALTTVQEYESGKISISINTLDDIARALGVYPSVLLDDDYKPTDKNTTMSIKFILKNGCSFTTKCENFSVNKNGLGQVVGCNMTGIKENKPIYVELEEIVAIVRKISDEEE